MHKSLLMSLIEKKNSFLTALFIHCLNSYSCHALIKIQVWALVLIIGRCMSHAYIFSKKKCLMLIWC